MSGTPRITPAIYSLEQKREMILAKLGKRAVLRETGVLVGFTVEELDLQPGHFNAKGETVHGIHLAFPGPARVWLPHLDIGAAWGYADIEPNRWSFCSPCGGGWEIQFSETVWDVVAELCKVHPEVDKSLLFKMADRALRHARLSERVAQNLLVQAHL